MEILNKRWCGIIDQVQNPKDMISVYLIPKTPGNFILLNCVECVQYEQATAKFSIFRAGHQHDQLPQESKQGGWFDAGGNCNFFSSPSKHFYQFDFKYHEIIVTKLLMDNNIHVYHPLSPGVGGPSQRLHMYYLLY